MPFIITLLAGLSTVIGYFLIYIRNDNNKVLIISLAFASGVMFYISLFDLIPESIYLFNKKYFVVFSILLVSIFMALGIRLAAFFNRFISSDKKDLIRVGIISMIAIVIHNVPEGIVTFLTSTNNMKLGISLAIAIALHNIPEGISISLPIYYGTGSKFKAFYYTFISGISEFFGAVIASMCLKRINTDFFMAFLYAFTSGIMFYISLFELLPASFKYKKGLLSVFSFIFGIIFIYISILLLH